MLNAPKPDDYVLATGQTWSIRDFVNRAAACLDFDLEWTGEGEAEVAIDRKSGKIVVAVDPHFFRPADVELLVGNSSKAQDTLGWRQETSFDQLVEMMVRADNDRCAR